MSLYPSGEPRCGSRSYAAPLSVRFLRYAAAGNCQGLPVDCCMLGKLSFFIVDIFYCRKNIYWFFFCFSFSVTLKRFRSYIKKSDNNNKTTTNVISATLIKHELIVFNCVFQKWSSVPLEPRTNYYQHLYESTKCQIYILALTRPFQNPEFCIGWKFFLKMFCFESRIL